MTLPSGSMYTLKKVGPEIEPWGTPQYILYFLDECSGNIKFSASEAGFKPVKNSAREADHVLFKRIS